MLRTLTLVILMIACAASATSQDRTAQNDSSSSQRIGVYVSLSGEDVVGQGLAYAIREELRRSAAFDVASYDTAGLQIHIVSIDDTFGDTKGQSSAIALVYTMSNFLDLNPKEPQTWYPIYLTSQVLSLGRSRIESQAKSTVATLESLSGMGETPRL